MTKSKFLKVKSPDSDYTVVIFDKCDTVVKDQLQVQQLHFLQRGKDSWEILESLSESFGRT